jgi:polyhydroxyalkanoate synthase
VPVLNIYAEKDHIIPVSCTRPLGDHVRQKFYREICFHGGHIGVFVSSKARGVVAGGLSNWMIETQGARGTGAAKKPDGKKPSGTAAKK